MKSLLLTALVAIPATASADMYSAEYQACNQSTTVDIVECVSSAGKKWDARLKPAFDALVERSEPAQLPALEQAQRLWAEYRDANCTFYAGAGGTLAQTEAAECFRAMTRARVCELQQANLGEGRPSAECAGVPPAQQAAAAPLAPQAAQTANGGSSGSADSAAKSPLEAHRYSAGVSFLLMHNRGSKSKPNGSLHTYVMFEEDLMQAGGSAVFGWLEGPKQVVLMSHAKYLPSVRQAATTRSIDFPRMLANLDHAPRYTMTCVWIQDDGSATQPLRVYGERDDANSGVRQEPALDSLRATWVHVPAARAAGAFGDRDYCTEIAHTEKTAVPLWEDAVR